MMVLVITVLCALAGSTHGSVVAWPNPALALQPSVLNSIIPAQTKAFGYSTTEYINNLPHSYTYGLQPQFAYQVPHLSGISSLQSAYYPVADLTYYPASVFYPPVGSVVSGVPASPVIPSAPVGPTQPPSAPSEQPAGDADTAVIESADIPLEQQRQEQSTATQSQSGSTPLPPTNTFPNFPSFPQFPQGPSQLPCPQIPQLPEVSFPSFPQFPQLPSNPLFPQPQPPDQSSPSAFPGNIGGDKGLNDEDTISVESA